MKKSQAQKIEQYLNDSAATLGLGDWQITLEAGEPDPAPDMDIFADVRATEQYRTARVRVSKTFLTKTAQEQRALLAHELCHLFTARMAACCEYLRSEVSSNQYEMWERSFSDSEEYAVEQFSRLICHVMALPKFG